MRAPGSRLLIAFVLAAVGACSSGGDSESVNPSIDEPVDTSAPSSSDVDLSPESAELGVGVTVSRRDGSSIAGMSVARGVDDILVPDGFNPAGPPLDVHVPDGAVREPVAVSIPGLEPPAGAIPLLLHRNDVGGWESIPATFSSGRYEAEALSFSWYWPGWADTASDWVGSTVGSVVDAAGNVIDAGVDWVTGRTDPPETCGSDPYSWVATAGSPPDGAFHVCLDQNPTDGGSERVEVKIKSNRSFAMWVVVPRNGADYVWVEGSSWELVGPVLSAFTGGTSERVLLGPGRTLTVGYQRPSEVSSELDFFAYQDTVTQAFTLLTRHVGEVNAELGILMATISCFDEGLEGLGDVSWDRASGCFSSGLGATTNQVELAFDRAVGSGRISLDSGDIDAFRSSVLRTERLSSAAANLKTVAGVLAAGRFAADAVVLANDAALGLVEGAGTLRVNLVASPGAPPTSAPAGAVEIAADGLSASLRYEHPSLGSMTIKIVRSGGGSEYQRFLPSVTATVDATGDSAFEWFSQENYEEFDFWGLSADDDVDTPVDALGHVFLKWNPGRFTGVSVLIPTNDGFDSIGTLTDDFYDAFYYAFVVDVDNDAVFELDQNFQICEPTCAGGVYYSHIWPWDGSSYSGPSDPPGAAPPTFEDGIATVRTYLLAAGARSYEEAWSSLSAAYQRAYGSYDSFVAFWDSVDNVGIDSTSLVGEIAGGEPGVSVEASLRYSLRDGTTSREIVHIDISLVGGQLIISDYRFIRQT